MNMKILDGQLKLMVFWWSEMKLAKEETFIFTVQN